MKMTLLELTQNILSAMDAEQVTSIEDTVESMQVAEEIRNSYYENFGNYEIKSRLQLDSLEDFTDVSGDYPHTLKIPDNVDNIKWMKYNWGTVAAPEWHEVTYITPEQFLELVLQNVDTNSTTEAKDYSSGLIYYISKESHPTYWTTFDNEYVVFDSLNTIIEADVDPAKTMIYAEVIPVFTMSDSFTPDLDDKFFPALLAEAKSACFVNYKGVANSKEEQRSRRQMVRHQNNRARYNERRESSVNYGRS